MSEIGHYMEATGRLRSRVTQLEEAIRTVGTDCRLYVEERRCSVEWPDDSSLWCGGCVLHAAMTGNGGGAT